jgi:hypothetical protein
LDEASLGAIRRVQSEKTSNILPKPTTTWRKSSETFKKMKKGTFIPEPFQ